MEAPNGNGGGAPFPLSDAAPLCHDLPSDIADLDVSIVDPFVLGSLSLADTWKQVKEILTQEAPHVLPVETVIPPPDQVLSLRSTRLGAGPAEEYLSQLKDVEKMALIFKINGNEFGYRMLTGQAPPENWQYSDLLAALTEITKVAQEWEGSTPGGRVNPSIFDNAPIVAASDVLASITGRLSTTATLLSRFSIVPHVTTFAGVSVFSRNGLFHLQIDGAEFPLGEDFVPSNDVARQILAYWDRSGGIRYELYELSPEEEARIPMLLGLISYKTTGGRRRFEVTTPSMATTKLCPPTFGAMRDVTDIMNKFNEHCKSWTPPAQFSLDYIPLYAQICRDIKLDWTVYRLDQYRQMYITMMTGSLSSDDHPEGMSESDIARRSFIKRLDELLKRAVASGRASAFTDVFNSHDGTIGGYRFTSNPVEAMKHVNAHRQEIRNVFRHREEFNHGQTFPGVPWGCPDAGLAYLKVKEIFARFHARFRDLPLVLMGVGYSLAMGPAFPIERTTFCDLQKPKNVADAVPITIANALTLLKSDGRPLDIEDSIYISDAYGAPGCAPKEYYRQVDVICDGRPAAGAIKFFLGEPDLLMKAVSTLARHYHTVSYCGVTKAHTGEFYVWFQDRRSEPEKQVPQEIMARCLVFMALHSVRTDLANYFYTGNVRMGVRDFARLARIDQVIQRHGFRYVGAAWRRTVPLTVLGDVVGRKARSGADTRRGEQVSLAELAMEDDRAELEALASAEGFISIPEETLPLTPAVGTSTGRTRTTDGVDMILPNDDEGEGEEA
jgi:hypothetical protein